MSVLEFDEADNFKVLDKRVFDLSKLTVKSGKSSDDKKSRHLVNKRRFETLNLAYEVDKLVKAWHAKEVVIEDLNFTKKLASKCRNMLCKEFMGQMSF